MQNKTEISEPDEKGSWPPQPDRNYRVSKIGVSQIEFDGQFLRCRWKTIHPAACGVVGGLSTMMFIPLKDAWELFPRLFTPPFTMIHRHPAAVIKICIILGLMCAFCAGITIWLFRVRMKPTLSIDLANQVFEFADATGLTPAKAMPMSAITGLRTRTAPTFRRQLTFVEVGVQKGRSNKTEWRSFALLPSLTEAQMVMDEISVFTRIPIAS